MSIPPVPTHKRFIYSGEHTPSRKAWNQKGIYYVYNTTTKCGYVEITGCSMNYDTARNLQKYEADGYTYATDPDYEALTPIIRQEAEGVFTRFDGKADTKSIVYMIVKAMGPQIKGQHGPDFTRFRKDNLDLVEEWRQPHVVALLKEDIERQLSERKKKAKAKRAGKKPSPNSEPDEPFVWHGM